MATDTAAPLRIVLLANYVPDDQQSMQRFAKMMDEGLRARGCEVRVVRPSPVLAHFSAGRNVSKWLGYIDKYVLFPIELKRHLPWASLVHICDHSNAVYIPTMHHIPHVITCHDLLAVRAALGENTDCMVSPFGRRLQAWILQSLQRATAIVCDSQATLIDVQRLIPVDHPQKRKVIPLGLSYPFSILPKQESAARLRAISGLQVDQPFVLHVGSSQERKNRDGVMRIFARISNRFAGQLVFAGSPLTPELEKLASTLGVSSRMIVVTDAADEILEALYNRAFALLFPSRSEGFGWPIIEAQASGCPVLVSDRGPCPEVAGEGAIVHACDDEEGFANSLLSLLDQGRRQQVVNRGTANLSNFSRETMIDQYLSTYEEILNRTSLSRG